MIRDTQWVMDSDGSLVPYHDPFASVTAETVNDAELAQNAVIDAKATIERSFVMLAILLDAVERDRLYLSLGYETFAAWVQSPEIEISKRMASDLIRVRREIVPILAEQLGSEDAAFQVLLKAGVSKARALLPLARDEGRQGELVEIAAAASDLTWKDVRAEVNRVRGIEQAIDAENPAIFFAKVRHDDTYSRVEVNCTTGADTYRVGVLTIRNDHWLRWEQRFGKFIEYLD